MLCHLIVPYNISAIVCIGTQEEESQVKKGYKVPRLPMANADLARLINSDEIQSVVNAPKEPTHKHVLKKNPLKNLEAMIKLNPYHAHIRQQEVDNAVSHLSLMHVVLSMDSSSSHQLWCFYIIRVSWCRPSDMKHARSGSKQSGMEQQRVRRLLSLRRLARTSTGRWLVTLIIKVRTMKCLRSGCRRVMVRSKTSRPRLPSISNVSTCQITMLILIRTTCAGSSHIHI